MLQWVLCFFLMAVLAALVGFGLPLPTALAGIAKILFFVFLVLTLVTLVAGSLQDRREP